MIKAVDTGGEEPKVLIVDDLKQNRCALKGMLRKVGIEAIEADGGPEALKLAEVHDFALALVDVQMPGMDGYELANRLKARKEKDVLPVIFVTAMGGTDAMILKAYESGAVDFVQKPIKREVLIGKVNVFLDLYRGKIELEKEVSRRQEADEARKKLLGIVSHDLKNPFMAIRGIADYLISDADEFSKEEVTEMLENIVSACDSTIELMEDLVALSSIETGNLILKEENHDICELLQSAYGLSQASAAQKRMRLELEMAVDAMIVHYDEKQIRRVILNLLSNAIKYAPMESRIVLSLSLDCEDLLITVSDEGPGIADEEQRDLFTEFSTASTETTGGESSTGLGLAACKKIVEAHEGEIGMRNLPTIGAEFMFRLPKERILERIEKKVQVSQSAVSR